MKYYDLIRDMSTTFNLRLDMVERAEVLGISRTAREYRTTRNTVRKWLKRHHAEGLNGLKDKSRAPKHIPHKTSPEIERRVIKLREEHPAWGPERLKMHYELSPSAKALGRIIRAGGLVKKRKKKWKKRRDLRELKKKTLKALQFIQVDTKDLSDVERYWPQIRRKRLPRYEFTARDVRTGGSWYAWSHTKDTASAALFAGYLLGQLKKYEVDMSRVIIQTDNGSEYIGSVSKKKGKSAFEQVLEAFKVRHSRIPPSSPTWNSDVESFHRIIEDEFYDLEDYRDKEEFKAKGYAYQLYSNFKRMNRYRGRKTPVEILGETVGGKISPQVFNFMPVILDDFYPKGGYDVPYSVNRFSKKPLTDTGRHNESRFS